MTEGPQDPFSSQEPTPPEDASGPELPEPKNEPEAVPRRRAGDSNPVKRRLVTALLGLYAVSAIAAAAVLWRAQIKSDDKDIDLKPAKGILASMKKKDGVAMIAISGPIYRSEGGRMFEKGAQQWARRIEKMAKRDDVKAIVLAINSPGGSVGAVQELHSVIKRVRKEHDKPIVAHLGDVAASGGYYLAAACDRVVAHPGTLVGSIGVIFSNMNLEGVFGKIGVKMRVIKSGKMKDIGSAHRPMTPEEKALLQELIDNSYGQFFSAVASGRKMEDAKLKPLADGRIFTGEQALENGLVDDLGDTYDAVLVAAKLGGLEDEQPKIIRGGESFSSMFEMFESRLRVMRSPELAAIKEIRSMAYHGLEYRWAN
jgi:protease-4